MMVLMILRWGLAALLGWLVAAHAVAFWRTKRLLYALIGLSGLAFISVIWIGSVLSGGDSVSFLPFLGAMAFVFAQMSAGAPSPEYREYASPRALLLFRKPLPEPLPDERLAAAPPRQSPPPPRQILIMTVVMLAGIALLASLL